MTIGARTPGAWGLGTTSVTPALPASPAAGDMMILFVGAKPYTATINQPNGWTRIGTQQTNGTTGNATDAGSVTWSVFYRAWQSGDTAPAVSITSGNTALGVIHGKTKTADAWVTPTAYFGSDTSSGTAYSATMASSSGQITSGDALIHFTFIAGNNSTFGSPTLTATTATIGASTESPATEGTTGGGLDCEASSATAACTAGTSTADAVAGWTLSVAQTGGSALVRLRESLTQTLTQSSRFDNSPTFYAHTVTRGAVTVTQSSRFDNSPTFYAHTVTQQGPAQDLTQSARFDNSATFYAPTVTRGAVTVTQSARFDNAPTFYTHTVSPGAVTLTQSARFDNAPTFYTHEISSGASSLVQSARFDNAPTFYTHTVSPGAVSLAQAARFDNAQTFYSPTLTAGASTLTQSARFDNAQAFYSPTVTPGPVSVEQSARFDNEQTFYTHTLTGGGTALVQTARFDNTNLFYPPTVTTGATPLTQTARFDNTNRFFAADVGGSYTITAAQARLLWRVYLLHGLAEGSPLVNTTHQRAAGGVEQSITTLGEQITISTTAVPAGVGVAPGAMIEELAYLHGLDADLVVTSTTRDAGTISQTIAETAGPTVTVTRSPVPYVAADYVNTGYVTP